MFGGISLSLLLDMQRREGVGYQLPLKLHIPSFEISEDYLTSVPINFKHNNGGTTEECTSGGYRQIDHPSFTELRNYLSNNGYIKMETSYTNGDVVLSEFVLNGTMFDVGSSFPCASAMKLHLKFSDKE